MNKWIKRSLQVSAVAGGIVLAGAAAANADQVTQHAGGNPGVLNSNQASVGDVQVPVNVSGNAIGVAGIGDAKGLGSGGGSAKAISKSASAHGSGDDVSQENGGNPGILNGNQASIGDIQVPVNVSGNGIGVAGIGDALGLGSGDGSAKAISKSASAGSWGGDDVTQENGDNPGILNGNQASIRNIQVPVNVSGNAIGVAGIGDALGEGSGDGSAKAISKSASAHGSGDDVSQENGGNPGILNGNQAAIGDIQVPVNVSGNGIAATLLGDALGLGSGDGSASAWS